MKEIAWHLLQLFAEGEQTAPGNEAQAPAAEVPAQAVPTVQEPSSQPAADTAEQELRQLGVPEERIQKQRTRRKGKTVSAPVEAPKPQVADPQPAPASVPNHNTPAPASEEPPAAPSLDELIQKYPDLGTEMQRRLQDAQSQASAAELARIMPGLKSIAPKYAQDPEHMDLDALNQAIMEDDDNFREEAERLAIELNTSFDAAMKIAKLQHQVAASNARVERFEKQQEIDFIQQQNRAHFDGMKQQAAALQEEFPDFDLDKEMENPTFVRMTAPSGGLNVAQAYHALHYQEIAQRKAAQTAQEVTQKLTNSVQAGAMRPVEAGASSQAPSVATFDYSNASPEQRKAFKKELQQAWARGERVCPGQGFI